MWEFVVELLLLLKDSSVVVVRSELRGRGCTRCRYRPSEGLVLGGADCISSACTFCPMGEREEGEERWVCCTW